MLYPEDIILKPHVTEKSNGLIALGKYTFSAHVKSTKPEIRDAVEAIFGVKVKKVNVINYEGKKKRLGFHRGKRSDRKIAIVTIDTEPQATVYLEEGGVATATTKKYKTSIEEFGAVS